MHYVHLLELGCVGDAAEFTCFTGTKIQIHYVDLLELGCVGDAAEVWGLL
jgi:hypothetical protein